MKYEWKKITIIILGTIVLALPLILVINHHLSLILGILVDVILMVNCLIGLRPMFINKWINLASLYVAHGILAILAIIISIIELIITKNNSFKIIGYPVIIILVIMSLLSMIFLSKQLERIPKLRPMLKKIKIFFNKIHFTREIIYYLHSLFPILVLLITLKVEHSYLVHAYPLFNYLFLSYNFFFIVIFINFLYMTKIKISRYEVISTNILNNDVIDVGIKFKNGRNLKIKGGQYLFIHTKGALPNEYHPFSILSLSSDQTIIHFGIRMHGDYTKTLSQLKIGDCVKVRGVYGHFTYRNDHRSIVAIAGGIGIVPCFSMLASIPEDIKATLIWSVHNDNEVNSFKDEIKKLNKNTKIIIHNSQVKGRLNIDVIKKYIDLNDDANYYLCGPTGMVDMLHHSLIHEKINDEQIIMEGFAF